jgi:hypothetical protein
MPKVLKSIICLSLCIMTSFLVLSGCSKSDDPTSDPDPDPELYFRISDNQTQISVSYKGGISSVAISTNIKGWTCKSDQEWCVPKVLGNSLECNVEGEYAGLESRTAIITFYNGKETLGTLKIVQTPNPNPIPEKSYLKVGDNITQMVVSDRGGIANIYVDTNVKGWSCTSDQNWCKMTNTEASVMYDVEAGYAGTEPRMAMIIFYNGEEALDTLKIIQDPHPDIQVVSFKVSPNGGEYTVIVKTAVSEWSTWTNESWLTVSKVSGATLKVVVAARPTGVSTAREGKVYLKAHYNETYFVVMDDDPKWGGDDYNYGDNEDWD